LFVLDAYAGSAVMLQLLHINKKFTMGKI